ncbi:UNVERIFIED_ORG: hypothetical protein LHJ69_00045 [Shinella sp. XGS7]|nr:hypothetical protein [Shinella sp. XGS7]
MNLHRQENQMPRLAITSAFLAALLAGCATPSVDRGFVVRTDLRTTDCEGNASPEDIHATPGSSDPFNFLNLRENPLRVEGQPDRRPKVRDCTKPSGEVPRTAGLALKRGDTLYLGTGAVGPAFQADKLPRPIHTPAALAGPVKVTLRSVHPTAGRLYAEEDMLLAAALSMARAPKLKIEASDLAPALDRQQVLLWNSLMGHLRLWRSSVGNPPPGVRPALALLVDSGSWCLDVRSRLSADDADRRELTRFFTGTEGDCPGGEASRSNIEFSRITNPARNAVQAIATAPKPSGGYYPDPHQLALFTQVTVDLNGARIGAHDSASSTGAWTLLDWHQAEICKDKAGQPLTLAAFRMRDGHWVHVKQPVDTEATVGVRLVFTQTLQAREFFAKGHWSQRWKRVLDTEDLDKLYPRDLSEVRWSGEPADAAMCLISSTR